jgi:hypothetical protein
VTAALITRVKSNYLSLFRGCYWLLTEIRTRLLVCSEMGRKQQKSPLSRDWPLSARKQNSFRYVFQCCFVPSSATSSLLRSKNFRTLIQMQIGIIRVIAGEISIIKCFFQNKEIDFRFLLITFIKDWLKSTCASVKKPDILSFPFNSKLGVGRKSR